MRVYPNPTVEPFTETRFYRPGENSLTINGHNLNVGASERDIKITVILSEFINCFRLVELIVL